MNKAQKIKKVFNKASGFLIDGNLAFEDQNYSTESVMCFHVFRRGLNPLLQVSDFMLQQAIVDSSFIVINVNGADYKITPLFEGEELAVCFK